MIKNFDEVKKQLAELTDLVNGFKSEAVQLRIIDVLLAGVGQHPHSTPSPLAPAPSPTKPAAKNKTKGKNAGSNGSPKPAGRLTPKKAIVQLIAEKYFTAHRTAPEVQKHIKDKSAATFSVGALQMALNRLLHDKTIQREKNADEQYEYWT